MRKTRFSLSSKIFDNNTTLEHSDLHHRLRQGVLCLQFEFEAVQATIWLENAVLILKNIEFNAFFQVKKCKFLFFILKINFYYRISSACRLFQ